MKTITRKVMLEKEYYIARDGKEFTDEDDCLNYENELNIKSIEAYDEDFNRVDFESATYVVIHSDEELDFICEVCDYNCWTVEGLNGYGLYRYNSHYTSEKWERVKFPYFLKDFIEFI